MKFSQRIGKKPIKSVLQLESIDDDLKNRLWNIFRCNFLDMFEDVFILEQSTEKAQICELIWISFLNRPIDEIPKYENTVYGTYAVYANLTIDQFRHWFFNISEWYDIYDLIEYVCDVNIGRIEARYLRIQPNFIEKCNEALKKEAAGYRIINKKVTRITSEEEIQEIEEASSLTDKLGIVSVHLKTALDLLADKKNPDYRNSIKESISAVESIAKIISNNSKDTLAGALDKIKSKIKIHPALERSFKQFYGYTSDADGIRHALTEVADCDFEDAKFMLVSCSAFINYLIAKSAKAGITFE